MSVFINETDHKVQFYGYRADGLKFKQDAPLIEPGKARYVNQDHYGDNDWYILVAFMKDANIPDAIGVKSETEGGGGSVGVSIGGIGVTVGGSGSTSKSFSNSMAVVKAGPHDVWTLKEDKEKQQWVFHEGGDYKNSELNGW